MTESETLSPRNLTFSQAQGYEDLPSLLALEELSDDARRELWDLLYIYIKGNTGTGGYARSNLREDWWEIAFKLHRDFHGRPIANFSSKASSFMARCEKTILDSNQPFNRVFDFMQIIMRHPQCPPEFIETVKNIFEHCRLAYFVDTNGPATILPMSTQQEGMMISEAIGTFHTAGLAAPEAHLRKAAIHINQRDWSGSIRESIHSVESVARQLAPDAKTLGPALKSLEAKRQLHPALKSAFEKLYGYTSAEEGIRHALINNSNSPADRDEALFMLGACASFASYLWRVHQPK